MIIGFFYTVDRVWKTLPQLVQQAHMSLLKITEHHDLSELSHPFPAMRHPGKSSGPGRNADCILYPGFRHGQGIDLPLRNHQRLEIHTLLHPKQDRPGSSLAPLLVLVPGLIKIRLAVFHKLHIPILVVEGEYQYIGVLSLHRDLILLRHPAGDPAAFQVCHRRRLGPDRLLWCFQGSVCLSTPGGRLDLRN